MIKLSDVTDLYDQDDLIFRLTEGLSGKDQNAVFLVGSALTAPYNGADVGVPQVEGVLDLIKEEFSSLRREELIRKIANSENAYQEAFKFLLGRKGQVAANRVIKLAVGKARVGSADYALSEQTTDEACRSFDRDITGWHLSPGVEALGRLAATHQEKFGQTILTTNFDPLIEVSIARSGGNHFRTNLHRDGNISQTEGSGTHVVHLHGYWYGSDTLHTPRQLNQSRPQLRNSLSQLLRNRTLVVMAYGGWDDAFTQALIEVLVDDTSYPEIIWCTYDKEPIFRPALIDALNPGLDRGRLTFYAGIDCHQLLPQLVADWDKLQPPSRASTVVEIEAPERTEKLESIEATNRDDVAIFNKDEDRPPVTAFYVGRSAELEELLNDDRKISFLTGIAGQGKSSLAAAYLTSSAVYEKFDHRVWRDCKEQSETLEDHLVYLVAALNDGTIKASELAKQPIDVLARLFAKLTEDLRILVVFDNVDNYIDLENEKLKGSADIFVQTLVDSQSSARCIFTCRPNINYGDDRIQEKRLSGLDIEEAFELFRLRSAPSTSSEISYAFEQTNGHALWLDLIAAHVASSGDSESIKKLAGEISPNSAEIPLGTLRTIWTNLKDREQIVLQALAETLKPTTDVQIANYLGKRLRFNKVRQALSSLKTQNLLVTKNLDNSNEAYELHPVIRAFIHKTFTVKERSSIIDSIMTFYEAFFGTHAKDLGRRSDPNLLQQWLEGAELSINGGRYENALFRLSEVDRQCRRFEPPGEYIRIVEKLIETVPAKDLSKLKHFDSVLKDYIYTLSAMGRKEATANALEYYENACEGKDARYINYCDLAGYSNWMFGELELALKWAKEGVDLKKTTGVDTTFGSDHTLALAQRDSGAYDEALEFFLEDADIEDVLSSGPPEEGRHESFYGNIGRCLHLMGQVESALLCYKKSAFVMSNSESVILAENEGYIRQWIGELLLKQGNREHAVPVLAAALYVWSVFAIPKAKAMKDLLESILEEEELVPARTEAERFFTNWVRREASF